MSRVIRAFEQFFDSAGDPIQDGWLEFLYSGTNNSPKPTFADAEHNIPNSNPVQLDGAGRCPNVFGVGVYRVVLYENDPITNLPGVQVQEFDPVQAEGSVTGSGDDFEEWDSTIVYETGNIVKVGEDYYKSYTTANFNNYPPSNADKWEQIDFIRYWNSNVSYEIDDITILDGVIYTSLQDANINNDPPLSPTYWSAIGAGTTLLNWTEDGTVFRPVVSNYAFGSALNTIGNTFMGGALYHSGVYEIYTASTLALTVDASQVVTFENFPIGPSAAPTTDYQFSNKKYVDDVTQLVDDKIVIFDVSFANLASPPATPVLNDLWYVSDNRYLKMYNGTGWVDVKSEVYFNNAASTPTGALNDIWYVSDTGQLKFHNGASWLAVTGEVTRYRHEETAIAGQTAFSTSFTISNESIYLNGVLLDTTEYTVGSSLITLDTAAAAGDIISIQSYSVPPGTTLSDYVLKTGDTMTGDLTINTDLYVDQIIMDGTNQIIAPDTNDTGSVGTTLLRFADGFFVDMSISGALGVDGAAYFDDVIVLYANPQIYASVDGAGELGKVGNRWANVHSKALRLQNGADWTITCGADSLTFNPNNASNRAVYFNNTGAGLANVWIEGNCSADSFTDRSPIYMGDDAIELIYDMDAVPGTVDDKGWGDVDHDTLPEGVKVKVKGKKNKADDENEFAPDEDGRDLGKQLQILTRATILLNEKIEEINAFLSI